MAAFVALAAGTQLVDSELVDYYNLADCFVDQKIDCRTPPVADSCH